MENSTGVNTDITLTELITTLIRLRLTHGDTIRVLVNHSDFGAAQYIPEEDGCPAYISLESQV